MQQSLLRVLGAAIAAGVLVALAPLSAAMAATPILGPPITAGDTPYMVVFSPDSSTAYVVNAGSSDVSVVTVATGIVSSNIHVGSIPNAVPIALAINPAGTLLYVANAADNSVSVIDIAIPGAEAVVGSPITVPAPTMIAFAPDGLTAYVVSSPTGGPGTVIPLTVGTPPVVGSAIALPIGASPLGIAITPNGAKAVVTLQNSSEAVIIDLATKTVSPTILVDDTPWGVTITPNGAFAIIANVNSATVSVIDMASGLVVHSLTLPVGTSPNWVDVTPDGTTAFVTNYSTNSLSVIDLATWTLMPPIAVGNNPHYVKVTPDGRTIYTPNDDSTVSVLTFSAIAPPAPALADTGVDAEREAVLATGGSALVLLGIVIVLTRRRIDELQG